MAKKSKKVKKGALSSHHPNKQDDLTPPTSPNQIVCESPTTEDLPPLPNAVLTSPTLLATSTIPKKPEQATTRFRSLQATVEDYNSDSEPPQEVDVEEPPFKDHTTLANGNAVGNVERNPTEDISAPTNPIATSSAAPTETKTLDSSEDTGSAPGLTNHNVDSDLENDFVEQAEEPADNAPYTRENLARDHPEDDNVPIEANPEAFAQAASAEDQVTSVPSAAVREDPIQTFEKGPHIPRDFGTHSAAQSPSETSSGSQRSPQTRVSSRLPLQSHSDGSYPWPQSPYLHPTAHSATSQPHFYASHRPPQYFYPMPHMNGFPNGVPPPMPGHGSPPFHDPFGTAGSPYSPYGDIPPEQRHNSVASRDSTAEMTGSAPVPHPQEMTNPAGATDDAGHLLSRISSAIPDLHLLLSRYKETHGQLGVREELIRKAEAEQADKIKRKEDYIDTLTKQLETATKHHSSESNKLRLEIGNLEEKHKELEERTAEAENSKQAMEEAKASLKSQKEALEREKTDLERAAAEEKDHLLREFEDWKGKAHRDFEADKLAIATEFARQGKDKDEALEAMMNQCKREFNTEKESMRLAHQQESQELEANLISTQRELEDKLESTQLDLDRAIETERENRVRWSTERDSLIKAWEDERDRLARDWSEQREFLQAQAQKEKDKVQQAWMELQASLTNKSDEQIEALKKENENLKMGWDSDKESFERVIGELRSVAENLGTERTRLQKTIECFGEVTDLKSKGDAYYIDAFSQLSKQILDLASAHFVHAPHTPPREVLSTIPSHLPNFLSPDSASRDLRCAYVAHLVSSILTIRVFTPFLFSLGRRHEKADTVFSSMSAQIRGKSVRKEAVWRQHTLVAAFTSPGAKQRINAAAGAVVEETMTSTKYFAQHSEEEAIRVAVRRIVKLAAETWRFARLEREMITAIMPPVPGEASISAGDGTGSNNSAAEQQDPAGVFDPNWMDSGDSVPGLWPAPSYSPSPSQGQSHVLLRLIPLVRREPTHESYRALADPQDSRDAGCVYNAGLALYSDSPPVVARMQETKRPQGTEMRSPPRTHSDHRPSPSAPARRPRSEKDGDHYAGMPDRSGAPSPTSPPFAASDDVELPQRVGPGAPGAMGGAKPVMGSRRQSSGDASERSERSSRESLSGSARSSGPKVVVKDGRAAAVKGLYGSRARTASAEHARGGTKTLRGKDARTAGSVERARTGRSSRRRSGEGEWGRKEEEIVRWD